MTPLLYNMNSTMLFQSLSDDFSLRQYVPQ